MISLLFHKIFCWFYNFQCNGMKWQWNSRLRYVTLFGILNFYDHCFDNKLFLSCFLCRCRKATSTSRNRQFMVIIITFESSHETYLNLSLALSNSFTLTRGEKVQSPHTSPKLVRKAPSNFLQEKESASSSNDRKVTNSNGKAPKQPPLSFSSLGSSSSTSSSSSIPNMSKVSLFDSSSSESSTAKDQGAPPIPPRKSMNHSIDASRQLKSQQTAPPERTPPERIQNCQIPDPAPSSTVANLLLAQSEVYEDEEDPICGPAETITGMKWWHQIVSCTDT